jgi:hypothetical protein
MYALHEAPFSYHAGHEKSYLYRKLTPLPPSLKQKDSQALYGRGGLVFSNETDHAGKGWPEPYYIYGVYSVFFGREITKCTAIYGVYTRFWPTLRRQCEPISPFIKNKQPLWHLWLI